MEKQGIIRSDVTPHDDDNVKCAKQDPRPAYTLPVDECNAAPSLRLINKIAQDIAAKSQKESSK